MVIKMNTNTPKVSIITASYNSSLYIESVYESIKAQNYLSWEWLITDDCSTDSSLDMLNKIAENDDRVHVFKNTVNSGAAVSRNVSLSHVSGDYIAFIDSDDLWLPNKLKQQITFMESAENINFSFTAYELINGSGDKLNKTVDSTKSGSFSYLDQLQKKATLGCSTVMLRRNAFSDISMPLIRTGQDYALWLKLLKTGNNAFLVPEILAQYRILPNSISRNKFKKAVRQWSIYREIESLSLPRAIKCFCFYAWRAVFRK